jgi:hemolysin activation/secretion protein
MKKFLPLRLRAHVACLAACALGMWQHVSASQPDVVDSSAAAQRNLEELGLHMREQVLSKTPVYVDTLGLEASTALERLVAVQVKSAVLVDDIESYWKNRMGGPVSLNEISDFHAWFFGRAAQKGFMAYAQTEVMSVRGGQQLNIQVMQPKINKVRILVPDSPEAFVYLKQVQNRLGQVFQVGLPLDTLALDQVLDSATHDLPLELEATLRAVGPELLDLAVTLTPVMATPGQTSSGVVQLNSHGLRQYGQNQVLAALTVGMPAVKSQLSLLAQASEGVAYARADYEGLLPALGSRWSVFGAHYRSQSVMGGAAAAGSEVAEFGLGLNRILGARRDLVFKGDVVLASRENESRLREGGALLSAVRDHQLRWRWTADNARLSPHPVRVELGVLRGYFPQAVSAAVSAGHYTRANFALKAQSPLNRSGSWRMSTHVRGQLASRNLDAHNQFALGGLNGVRAYTSADGVGDHGVLASLELTHDIAPALSVSVFYDGGQVQIQADPLASAILNRYSLQGAGVQLQGRYFQLHYTLTWAKGLKSYAAWQPSNIESSPGNSRTNVSVSYLF